MPNDMTPLNAEDEGLNLWELLDVIKSGWHWLVGGAVVGFGRGCWFCDGGASAATRPQQMIQPVTAGLASTTTTTKGDRS